MDESTPAGDILYKTIHDIGRQNIRQLLADGKSDAVIGTLLEKTSSEIAKLGEPQDTHAAALLTSLLHYLLTELLIPSQRKVTLFDTDIDIVIPDLRTLQASPKDAIVICIFDAQKNAADCINEIKAVQPASENIWLVGRKNAGQKAYVIEDETFGKIIQDIEKFLSSKKTTQFRMFGSD